MLTDTMQAGTPQQLAPITADPSNQARIFSQAKRAEKSL